MSIVIQSTPLKRAEDLSIVAWTLLPHIPESELLLEEMISSNDREYSYSSETDLVDSLLSGIHNTNTVYLQNTDLFINIRTLYRLPFSQTKKIIETQGASAIAKLNLNAMTPPLYTNNDFNIINRTIKTLGQPQASKLIELSITDRIYLTKLLNSENFLEEALETKNKTINKQAISFASEKSIGTIDFFHFYFFYINIYFSDNAKKGSNNNNLDQYIIDIYGAITSIANTLLNCPQIELTHNLNELPTVIKQTYKEDPNIGYPSISYAVFHLSKTILTSQINLKNLPEKVKSLFNQSLENIESSQEYSIDISQAGFTPSVLFKTQSASTRISINEDKFLFLG